MSSDGMSGGVEVTVDGGAQVPQLTIDASRQFTAERLAGFVWRLARRNESGS
jgi:hypothetical protein